MDPRERWQALQSNLASARRAFESGDRAAALARVDAALALDPDFLAAHTLRERILASAEVRVARPPITSPDHATIDSPRPLVSQEGWVRFEQRARQRRIERRVEAARGAIARNRLDEARTAMAEVRELDDAHPDLISLTMELDAAEHHAVQNRPRPFASRRVGPAMAAAAVFAAMIFGASLIDENNRLTSRPRVEVASLISPPPSTPLTEVALDAVATDEPAPEPTTGTAAVVGDPEPPEQRPVLNASINPAPSAPPVPPRPASRQPGPAPNPTPPASARTSPPPDLPPAVTANRVAVPPPPAVSAPNVPLTTITAPVRDPEPVASLPAAPSRAPIIAPAAEPVRETARVRDDQLILQTLQQYRTAYESLDVSRARAVWPAVNQTALTRAFAGLESQDLTFDNCAVDFEGDAASAVCRGTARYVPKVGSREPRVESRVWNFTLRRAGDDWRIETARAGR